MQVVVSFVLHFNFLMLSSMLYDFSSVSGYDMTEWRQKKICKSRIRRKIYNFSVEFSFTYHAFHFLPPFGSLSDLSHQFFDFMKIGRFKMGHTKSLTCLINERACINDARSFWLTNSTKRTDPFETGFITSLSVVSKVMVKAK